MKEFWRDVPSFEGLYTVSNFGVVKNKFGKALKPSTNKKGFGYQRLTLSKDGKTYEAQIHRLVAETFLPNPDNLSTVNHKDEILFNNVVYLDDDGNVVPEKSNLEWCTHQYNLRYSNARRAMLLHIGSQTIPDEHYMRHTYNCNFYCREQKAKNGLAPIEVVLTIDGDRKTLTLPKKYPPEEFKRLKKSKRSNELTNYLSTVVTDFGRLHMDFPSYSASKLLDLYSKGVRSSKLIEKSVAELADRYMKEVIGTRPTLPKYRATFKLFCDMYGDTNAKSIRASEIRRFVDKLRADGLKDSSIFNHYKRVKSLFTFGFETRALDVHPFATLKMNFAKSENQEFLTREEVERIYELKNLPPYLERVQQAFVFLCSTGLEVADAKELKPEDLKKHGEVYYFEKPRVKTKAMYFAVLIGHGLEIWRRYDGKIKFITTQNFNKYLRKLAEMAGIERHISSLCARHTYATLLLSGEAWGNKVPLEVLQRLLGHRRYQQTQEYAKLLDSAIFDAFGA